MTKKQLETLQREENRLRDVIRRKHYSLSTEESYVGWFRRYAKFLAGKSPTSDQPAEQKLGAFLTAISKTGVAAATQKQAFDSLRFYYMEVRREKLGDVQALWVKRPAFVRIAPRVEEVRALLGAIKDVGGYRTTLIVRLLYACGMRVSEPLNLRIKDVLIEESRLALQGTKGGGARIVAVPCELIPALTLQIKEALLTWENDRANGLPVALPGRLGAQRPSRKFSRQWAYLFPGRKPCQHPRTGEMVRYHLHERNVQRCVAAAVAAAGLSSEIVPHLLRHAYGTHAIKHLGATLLDLQSAYGHKQLQTTVNYVRGAATPVPSPLALLSASTPTPEPASDIPALPLLAQRA